MENYENKICIDSMIMTHAILNEDFKKLLLQNIGEDSLFTTGICKKETLGNIKEKLGISFKEAERKFKELEEEFSINYLELKEEDYTKGTQLFKKIISSGMKIKNKPTFLKDCLNIAITIRSDIKVFCSNDEDLEKACKKFNIPLEFIKIAESSEKVIKEYWKQYQRPKFRFWKRGRKAKK